MIPKLSSTRHAVTSNIAADADNVRPSLALGSPLSSRTAGTTRKALDTKLVIAPACAKASQTALALGQHLQQNGIPFLSGAHLSAALECATAALGLTCPGGLYESQRAFYSDVLEKHVAIEQDGGNTRILLVTPENRRDVTAEIEARVAASQAKAFPAALMSAVSRYLGQWAASLGDSASIVHARDPAPLKRLGWPLVMVTSDGSGDPFIARSASVVARGEDIRELEGTIRERLERLEQYRRQRSILRAQFQAGELPIHPAFDLKKGWPVDPLMADIRGKVLPVLKDFISASGSPLDPQDLEHQVLFRLTTCSPREIYQNGADVADHLKEVGATSDWTNIKKIDPRRLAKHELDRSLVLATIEEQYQVVSTRMRNAGIDMAQMLDIGFEGSGGRRIKFFNSEEDLRWTIVKKRAAPRLGEVDLMAISPGGEAQARLKFRLLERRVAEQITAALHYIHTPRASGLNFGLFLDGVSTPIALETTEFTSRSRPYKRSALLMQGYNPDLGVEITRAYTFPGSPKNVVGLMDGLVRRYLQTHYPWLEFMGTAVMPSYAKTKSTTIASGVDIPYLIKKCEHKFGRQHGDARMPFEHLTTRRLSDLPEILGTHPDFPLMPVVDVLAPLGRRSFEPIAGAERQMAVVGFGNPRKEREASRNSAAPTACQASMPSALQHLSKWNQDIGRIRYQLQSCTNAFAMTRLENELNGILEASQRETVRLETHQDAVKTALASLERDLAKITHTDADALSDREALDEAGRDFRTERSRADAELGILRNGTPELLQKVNECRHAICVKRFEEIRRLTRLQRESANATSETAKSLSEIEKRLHRTEVLLSMPIQTDSALPEELRTIHETAAVSLPTGVVSGSPGGLSERLLKAFPHASCELTRLDEIERLALSCHAELSKGRHYVSLAPTLRTVRQMVDRIATEKDRLTEQRASQEKRECAYQAVQTAHRPLLTRLERATNRLRIQEWIREHVRKLEDTLLEEWKSRRSSYDQAINGKYPFRDEHDRPILVTAISASSARSHSGKVYRSDTLRPWLEPAGATRTLGQLECRSVTAVDDPREASLVGQDKVVAACPIKAGTPLGFYGGVLYATDPTVPGKGIPDLTYTFALRDEAGDDGALFMLDGDNILARMNTSFEYDDRGTPRAQRSDGYNVDGAFFAVSLADGRRFVVPTAWALTDIEAGEELRWNYEYSAKMVSKLMNTSSQA